MKHERLEAKNSEPKKSSFANFLRKLGISALGLAMLGAMVVGADAATRENLTGGEISLSEVELDGNPDATVLFLAGMRSTAAAQTTYMAPVFAEFAGKLQLVDYTGETFDKNVVVAQIVDTLREDLSENEKVYLLGVSFGGLLMTDVLESANLTDEEKAKLRVIVFDAPTAKTAKDAHFPIDAAKVYFPGEISNKICESWSDCSRWVGANSSVSQTIDQVHYIQNNKLDLSSFRDIQTVYIENDGTDRVDQPAAKNQWSENFPGNLVVVTADMPHTFCSAYVTICQDSLEESFASFTD
jgi:pimeloyl-ACP methyl ester carboxylesterase